MELKEIWRRLKGIVVFGIAYMTAFFFMEARNVPIHIIHTKFDDMIPFCEYFIIPYILWYLYVGGTVLYLGLTDKDLKEYNKFIFNMELGMIIFVIISFVYPNGQNLRPSITVDSFCTQLIHILYTVDTSTNILPSLHVYASVACCISLCKNQRFRKHLCWQLAVCTLTVLICLSTMFIKQHSIIDVVSALFFIGLFYPIIYQQESLAARAALKKPVRRRVF